MQCEGEVVKVNRTLGVLAVLNTNRLYPSDCWFVDPP